MRVLLACVIATLTLLAPVGWAAVLDPESTAESPLLELDTALDAAGIDVAFNLNRRHVAGVTPRRPRIGALADLPPLLFPTTAELLAWEAAFAQVTSGCWRSCPRQRRCRAFPTSTSSGSPRPRCSGSFSATTSMTSECPNFCRACWTVATPRLSLTAGVWGRGVGRTLVCHRRATLGGRFRVCQRR
jgi:hypothetical protein